MTVNIGTLCNSEVGQRIDMDFLSSSDLHSFDPSLRDAMEEGSKTGSMTPIIKQELKYTILARRHNSGKGEIDLTDEKPRGKRELTTEERRKKERRKEQNRRAAARCREKKKKMSELVLQEFINEQSEKKRLEMEVESLKKEKAELKRLIDEHAFMCHRTFTPTPTVTPSYDDKTTFNFPPTTCSVPSPYPGEMEVQRDNVTPSSIIDTLDDVFGNGEISKGMYPTVVSELNPVQWQDQLDLEEIILPDEFHAFTQSQCSQPSELEQLNGGRGSISEYNDPYHH